MGDSIKQFVPEQQTPQQGSGAVEFKICASAFHVGDPKLPKSADYFYRRKPDKKGKRGWSKYCRSCDGKEKTAAKKRRFETAKEVIIAVAEGTKRPQALRASIDECAEAWHTHFMTPEEGAKAYRALIKVLWDKGNYPLIERMIWRVAELSKWTSDVKRDGADDSGGITELTPDFPYRERLLAELGITEATCADGRVLRLANPPDDSAPDDSAPGEIAASDDPPQAEAS